MSEFLRIFKFTLILAVIFLFNSVKVFANTCHTPGAYNSFVLSLEWLPGFCNNQNKKECIQLKNKNPSLTYANNEFMLHGLWPNNKSCGHNYGYCQKHSYSSHNFCSLPKINITASVASKLRVLMPGFRFGSCLERHEWYKHGACVMPVNPNSYFQTAINLVAKINNSSFVKDYVKNNLNKWIEINDFYNAFDSVFGPYSHKYIMLACSSKGMLSEIRINLPKNINNNLTMRQLINSGNITNSESSNCGSKIYLLTDS